MKELTRASLIILGLYLTMQISLRLGILICQSLNLL